MPFLFSDEQQCIIISADILSIFGDKISCQEITKPLVLLILSFS